MKKERGQNVVEYAVMLAIIVGIGWLLLAPGNSLGSSIKNVFASAGNLFETQQRDNEEARRQQADYANAQKMAAALRQAMASGNLTMPKNDKAFVEILVTKNGINGAAGNGTTTQSPACFNGITVNGKDYTTKRSDGNSWWRNLWDISGLSEDDVSRTMQQTGSDWYSVRIDGNGNTYYATGKYNSNGKVPGNRPGQPMK